MPNFQHQASAHQKDTAMETIADIAAATRATFRLAPISSSTLRISVSSRAAVVTSRFSSRTTSLHPSGRA